MTDEREYWEVVWCLRLQTATDYIRYLNLQGRERVFAQRAYVPNGGKTLETWAQEMIQRLISKANQMVLEHGDVSIHALSVAQPYITELEKAGCLSGHVQIAGITKTDQV
jgi:hypothetical protein